ncbi:MAG TPA: hypothetical protein VGB66_03835 [Longimicrobium sp.]
MRTALSVLSLVLLAACASGGRGGAGPGAPSRDLLWRQAHQAMHQDSSRIALAAFQRLAAEHPGTVEGNEARFYLGTLYLDPRTFDATRASEHLEMYLAADTMGGRQARRPEAVRLLSLSRTLVLPCEQRTGALRCEPAVVTRRTPGETVVVRDGDQSAEVARLRREVAERDGTIRELREELQRIRNTLAPRPR